MSTFDVDDDDVDEDNDDSSTLTSEWDAPPLDAASLDPVRSAVSLEGGAEVPGGAGGTLSGLRSFKSLVSCFTSSYKISLVF